VVLDSAMPSEIERWQNAGYNAYGVLEKPQAPETYPIIKRMLRDPVLYNQYHDEVFATMLHARGLDPDEFDTLPLTTQRELLIDLEEHLSDEMLPQADIERLRACAVLRVDSTCVISSRSTRRINSRGSGGRTRTSMRWGASSRITPSIACATSAGSSTAMLTRAM
jgi:hypothetical protein